MKKQTKIKKPSVAEQIAATTAQNYGDCDTTAVIRRRAVVSYQVEVQEAEIAALVANLASSRKELSRLNAQIAGLNAVVGKR